MGKPKMVFAQGLGRYGTHFRGFEARQPFAKAGQTVPARLHGLGGEVAVLVQPATLAHGFFQILRSAKFAVVHMADF
jgi:hypothetical protein